MTKRINKYIYLFVIQGRYSDFYGYEDVCQSEDYKEARHDLKAYQENEKMYPHRMIKRRKLNPIYINQVVGQILDIK